MPYKSVAEIIGRRLAVSVVAVSARVGWIRLGLYASYLGSDLPASSAITRRRLGWQPVGPALLEDLDHPEYFRP